MDLLKVLDMTEGEKQITTLKEFLPYETYCQLCSCRISIADLAFRLRDEAYQNYHNAWCQAKEAVWLHEGDQNRKFKKLAEKYNLKDSTNRVIQRREVFFVNRAKPIHWIIAALIAKETQ